MRVRKSTLFRKLADMPEQKKSRLDEGFSHHTQAIFTEKRSIYP